MRGKCNALQALPNQLALLITNLPSGYHRELQLAKGPIIEAVQEIKACLDILLFSLPNLQVNENITEQKKYDYLFSVDTLNAEVRAGKPSAMPTAIWGTPLKLGNIPPTETYNTPTWGVLGI